MLGMEKNIGALDRNVRFGLGGLLLAVGVASLVELLRLGSVRTALAIGLGLVLVGTATTRLCLLYRLVGADTCSTR